jgi:hypothetical protein
MDFLKSTIAMFAVASAKALWLNTEAVVITFFFATILPWCIPVPVSREMRVSQKRLQLIAS